MQWHARCEAIAVPAWQCERHSVLAMAQRSVEQKPEGHFDLTLANAWCWGRTQFLHGNTESSPGACNALPGVGRAHGAAQGGRRCGGQPPPGAPRPTARCCGPPPCLRPRRLANSLVPAACCIDMHIDMLGRLASQSRFLLPVSCLLPVRDLQSVLLPLKALDMRIPGPLIGRIL